MFPLHYFTFYYQPRHPHNCFISQLRWYCVIISMNVFYNINSLMVQRRMCYVGISMNVFYNINALISQLGTSCSFDSPGLTSESVVYPGLFAISENNAVGVVPFCFPNSISPLIINHVILTIVLSRNCVGIVPLFQWMNFAI